MTFHETDAIRDARDLLARLADDEKTLVDDELTLIVLRAQQAWPQLGEREQIVLGFPCISGGFGRELADLGLFEHNPSCTCRGRKHINYEWVRTELGRVCWVLHYSLATEGRLAAQAADELIAEAQKLKLGY